MARHLVFYSDNNSIEEAKSSISSQIKSYTNLKPISIIFSCHEDFLEEYSKFLFNIFPTTEIIGTPTYVAFSSEGFSHKGINGIAIFDKVECYGGIIHNISKNPSAYTNNIKETASKLSSYENTCCLEFTCAFKNGEELVQDTFLQALENTNIQVVGSSTGNSLQNESKVSYNGKCFSDACVYLFIKNLSGKIFAKKENLYHPTEKKFKSTNVDVDSRTVYEYDYKPAALLMSEELNIPIENLEHYLSRNPIGQLIDNNIYITDSHKVNPDNSISYFSRIFNYTQIALLKVKNPYSVWNETFNSIKEKNFNIDFSIAINCIGRTKYFEEMNLFEEFTKVLKTNYGDYIGIAGFGEQMNFMQLNQTFVILIFEG
jgi:hypothetical protein